MRTIPFSYLEQKVTTPPPAGGIPQSGNILLRYEDVAQNFTGSTWNDTSGLGNTTGTVPSGGSTGDFSSGSLQLADNRGTTFKIAANNDIDVKSLVIVWNTWNDLGTSGGNRDYFWDMRDAGVDNSGYFNQFDSVATGTTTLFGNDGEYYSYDETDASTTGPQASSPANLTNGTNNINGGSATTQFLGPNGKSAYYTKRLWHFNFNTTSGGIGIRTTAEGAYFGSNDNPGESTPLGIFSIIGWSVALTNSEVTQLVDYYKNEGVLT